MSGLEIADLVVDLPRWPQMLERGFGIVARQLDEAEHPEVHRLRAPVSLLPGSSQGAFGAGAGLLDLASMRRDHSGRHIPYGLLTLRSRLRSQRKQISRLAGGKIPVTSPPLEH